MSSSQVLSTLADELVDELGPPHSVRRAYSFPVFTGDGPLFIRSVEAAVFTTPSPSVATALCALATACPDSTASRLDELGYFGSPLAVIDNGESLTAYRFVAPRVPRAIESVPVDHADTWVRRTLAREASSAAQLELPLSEGRDLLVTEARRGLARLVSGLITQFEEVGSFSSSQAFSCAIGAIRSELFDEPAPDAALVALVRPHSEALRFPHVPLEAVAELYETLGLGARDRRERGIAYTPAWIAEHLISRLPSTAFSVSPVTDPVSPATDPACGSGTFLVAYLDRAVAERARRGMRTAAADLVGGVAGLDTDPVALAASRLTLDLFAQRLGHEPQAWSLHQADATTQSLTSKVLMGNLPFGHRTHGGKDDVSSVILARWLTEQTDLESVALLLPESFAYAGGATERARSTLRERFRIDEILELPEELFERTAAATLAVIGNRGAGGSPVVRHVRRRDLAAFRVTGIPSRSFVAQLPPASSDPWVLSPFFGVLEKARINAHARLGDIAEMHLGFQAYGSDASFHADATDGPLVLEDPSTFMAMVHGNGYRLRRMTSPADRLRRTGRVELYGDPKLIIRTTTNRHQVARLAALPDQHGLWFNDKFIGVWVGEQSPPLRALAAYLQTAFVEIWLATNNPSRKLRVATLKQIPIPSLPHDWWERAAQLAPPNRTLVSPRWLNGTPTLLDDRIPDRPEWRWFERTVGVALGMGTSQLAEIERYLDDYLTVGRP